MTFTISSKYHSQCQANQQNAKADTCKRCPCWHFRPRLWGKAPNTKYDRKGDPQDSNCTVQHRSLRLLGICFLPPLTEAAVNSGTIGLLVRNKGLLGRPRCPRR